MIRSLTLASVWLWASTVLAQSLGERIAEVTQRPDYRHSRWGILIIDAADGSVVHETNADQLFVPASVTKLFTCAAALAELGPDYRFKTRVVTDGIIAKNTLFGDLTLIASGDPTLGGRNRPDGTMAFVDGDHTYADVSSTTAGITDTDPLTGMRDLARQVKRAGVTEIQGDVNINTQLFEVSRSSGSGPQVVSPIAVNDNVIDFVITVKNRQIDVRIRPETAFIHVDSEVRISGERPDVSVVPTGSWQYRLQGTVPAADATYVRIAPVAEPAAFAQLLFIECLRREGVSVSCASATSTIAATNGAQKERNDRVLAEHVSLPFSEVVKVTLKTSHNLYGSMLPCLIAAKHGQRTAKDGLALEGKFFRDLGLDVNGLALAGGAGGMPADSISPRAAVDLLRMLRSRPEFAALENGLPILGVDGTLARAVGPGSSAKGRVRAKTGTLVWDDTTNGRLLLRSKALAGLMTAKNGKNLIFAIFVNDVPLPIGESPSREGMVLGRLCEIIHESAP